MTKLTSKENLAVLIIDMDKLEKEEFKDFFDKCVWYINKINNDQFDRVTDAVEKVQEQDES